MAETELINKQDAIDALLRLGDSYLGQDEVKRGIAQSQRVIYELPSAERKGKWKISNLPKDKILRYCSKCGWGINLNDNRKYDYCPCCGARMVSKEDKKKQTSLSPISAEEYTGAVGEFLDEVKKRR